MLDVSRRFNGKPDAINDVKEHRKLLSLLATSGYGGGGLLDIPRNVPIKLMEDGDSDHLFDREEDAEIPPRNKLQHVIHQNTNLATQIAIVGSILQEVAVDIIEDSCDNFSDTLLKIKLLYQQGKIRKDRIEPYQLPHNARRGQTRTVGGTHTQGESLWKEWQESGLTAVDTDDYLNNKLETPNEIRENLLKCMNRCSTLAVRLHNVTSYVIQKRKCKWGKVTDAEWIKQTIGIKDSTSFFEKVIGIKS